MLSGEPFASAVFPFAPPVSRTVWGWLLMKPATSTKLALFCCYFYSTAGAVMQVFFYKTVTFWGCVDEVTDFCFHFWLFCTMEMAGGRAQRARRGIGWRGGTGGERSEPAEGSACGERTRRPARAVRRAAPPAGGRPPLLRRRGGAGCCGVQGIKKQTPCK